MNSDVWSTIFYNCVDEEKFYIVTLFDQKCGIILMQKIATIYSVINIIYDLADLALSDKYNKKAFSFVNNTLTHTRYYLRDIYSIDDKDISIDAKNICIFVKETKICV